MAGISLPSRPVLLPLLSDILTGNSSPWRPILLPLHLNILMELFTLKDSTVAFQTFSQGTHNREGWYCCHFLILLPLLSHSHSGNSSPWRTVLLPLLVNILRELNLEGQYCCLSNILTGNSSHWRIILLPLLSYLHSGNFSPWRIILLSLLSDSHSGNSSPWRTILLPLLSNILMGNSSPWRTILLPFKHSHRELHLEGYYCCHFFQTFWGNSSPWRTMLLPLLSNILAGNSSPWRTILLPLLLNILRELFTLKDNTVAFQTFSQGTLHLEG